MIQLNPYLSFDGDCREAMNFYKDCLGGELTLQTIGESPMAAQTPPESMDKVLHATLSKDGVNLLLASDMFDKTEVIKGNFISLCINCQTTAEIESAFAKLVVGGTVIHPLTTEFWGATYGQLKDKYGFNWMLNCEQK